jgi:hypothetical protein
MRGMGKRVEIGAASILVSEAEQVPETASPTYPSITPSMGFVRLIVTKGLLNVSSAKGFRLHFPQPRMGSASQSPRHISPTALRASTKARDGSLQKREED